MTHTMKRLLLSFLLTTAAITLSSPVFSEDDRRLIDESKIPVDGSSMTDFVPVGWMIESTIQNDLNGDGTSDVVLVLIEDQPLTKEKDMPVTRSRALLILLQTKTAKFQRIAVAKKLLRCTNCFGAMAGPEGGGADIRVAKRVIIVEELWGSRETVRTRFHFRYDSRFKRVLLIGEDIESFDRATGSRLRKSSNLLTGIQLIDGERYDEKKNRLTKIPTKKHRIPKIKRFIEDIDYEEYERQADSLDDK